jgi:hypothetical protein
MASKAKSGKSKTKAKKAAKTKAKKPAKSKPAKKAARKPVKKTAKKAAKKAARKVAKKPARGKKQKPSSVKPAAKARAEKKSASTTGKKPSMTEAKPAKTKKEKVAVGIAPSAPVPGKSRATGVAEEPADVDEYETQRQAAVEPFKRSGAAPKPGAAGRLFDDEAELEDYDPLFDEVEEEDE